MWPAALLGQTTSTGALIGNAIDPSGAALTGVFIQLENSDTGTMETTNSDRSGRFSFLLLSPGTYQIRATKIDFREFSLGNLEVSFTETLRVDVHLQLATRSESANVSSEQPMIQTVSVALGRVANDSSVDGLPLATRNFSQLAGLSPGVVVGVYNAGELGLGGTALSQIATSNDRRFAAWRSFV